MYYSGHCISKRNGQKISLWKQWRKVRKLFKGMKWLQDEKTVGRVGLFISH